MSGILFFNFASSEPFRSATHAPSASKEKAKNMSTSINIFILLNIFPIACLVPNLVHQCKCHKGISIIDITLEIIRSFRTAVLQPSKYDVLDIFNIQLIHTLYCTFKHPSMKKVRVGIKRGWTFYNTARWQNGPRQNIIYIAPDFQPPSTEDTF